MESHDPMSTLKGHYEHMSHLLFQIEEKKKKLQSQLDMVEELQQELKALQEKLKGKMDDVRTSIREMKEIADLIAEEIVEFEGAASHEE